MAIALVVYPVGMTEIKNSVTNNLLEIFKITLTKNDSKSLVLPAA